MNITEQVKIREKKTVLITINTPPDKEHMGSPSTPPPTPGDRQSYG